MTDRRIAPEDALAAFADAPAGEPLGTREVAEAIGCARRTAFDKLERLAEEGRLRTKTVGGNVRVWWPPADAGASAPVREAGGGFEFASEHVIVVEFRSAALGERFRAVSPDLRITLDGVVDLEGGAVLQYITVSGAPVREVFDLLEEFPSVVDVQLVARHDDEFRVEVRSPADSLWAAFRRHGGTTRAARLEAGELVLVGEVPSSADVAALAETAAAAYPDVELASVELDVTPRLFRSVVEERLTDKQWTALVAAYYGGYFADPRERTGTDVAERLGITRQTFHHHLRNVQRVVFGLLLENAEAGSGAGSWLS